MDFSPEDLFVIELTLTALLVIMVYCYLYNSTSPWCTVLPVDGKSFPFQLNSYTWIKTNLCGNNCVRKSCGNVIYSCNIFAAMCLAIYLINFSGRPFVFFVLCLIGEEVCKGMWATSRESILI